MSTPVSVWPGTVTNARTNAVTTPLE
jgi:hypothetical protein